MVLTGKYEHAMDAKNRLFVPAKHRESLGVSFMITRGTDRCLSVYSMDEWEKYTSKLEAIPPTQARQVLRFIYSNAQSVQPDAQGRVILSSDQIAYAEIQKDCVVVGVGNHVEIWSRENWTKMNEEIRPEEITDMLISLGM